MATGKRYFWIKLRESFLTSDTVDFMMSQKDGANYVVLYQMLCLKTINTGGRLSRTIGEIVIPYDVEKIQRDCKWFSADTIRVALDLYKRFGLIYEDVDGVLVLADHDRMVGTETDWSEKKRRQRNEQATLPSGDNVPTPVPTNVPQNVPIDIRDKSRDTKNDTTEDKVDNTSKDVVCGEVCAEPPASGRSTPAKPVKPEPTPSEFNIMLQDGSFYNVPMENIEVYKRLYPGVDVEQQLRNMMGWSMDAGPNRKTRAGVKRFITRWLIREQDRGGRKNDKNKRSGERADYAKPEDFY